MATNGAATALPLKDVLVKDYELKVPYLTDHFGRMWTRFNHFASVESALVERNPSLGDGKLSPGLAMVGAIVWYNQN